MVMSCLDTAASRPRSTCAGVDGVGEVVLGVACGLDVDDPQELRSKVRGSATNTVQAVERMGRRGVITWRS
jgi:hypothetical protein